MKPVIPVWTNGTNSLCNKRNCFLNAVAWCWKNKVSVEIQTYVMPVQQTAKERKSNSMANSKITIQVPTHGARRSIRDVIVRNGCSGYPIEM